MYIYTYLSIEDSVVLTSFSSLVHFYGCMTSCGDNVKYLNLGKVKGQVALLRYGSCRGLSGRRF